tara:strand:- start:1102 stop:2055 length:954 start_codon:yes stop_codon:yes gene_type:complete
MKILITGSSGFIGYHLSKSLLEENHEILGIDNINNYYSTDLKNDRTKILKSYNNFKFKKIDITNLSQLDNSFREFNPQRVVNLAAQAGVSYSISNPHAYVQSNLVGFVNVIECCRNNNVDGLIYASSSSIYGNNSKLPFSEKDMVDKPIALYGATKKANELIAHSYSHLYGLKTTGLRYFTVYGPWYRPDMAMFIFTHKIINNEKIILYNNGKILRDFTFVDDIVSGTKLAIQKNYDNEIFNLGNSKTELLKDVLSVLENELNKKAIIVNKNIKKGDMVETFADIEQSKIKLGYSPSTNIAEGIPILTKWFREYYKC